MSKAKKYRKKPVIVEAFLYEGRIPTDPLVFDIETWGRHILKIDDAGDLWIINAGGEMLVRNGDYIVKGIKGELYPVRADIFKKTYEEVEE